MIKYVAGLLFDDDCAQVVLVYKTRGPARLVGKWNAVGGKVEEGEAPLDAMRREFQEEAGVLVSWTGFLVLNGDGWTVSFFHAFNSAAVREARTCEEEEIAVHDIRLVLGDNIVPNLRWIIPMAFGHLDDHVAAYIVSEAEVA